jgi:hypothetical protein
MNNNNCFIIHVLQPCAVKIARMVVRGGKLVKVYLFRFDSSGFKKTTGGGVKRFKSALKTSVNCLKALIGVVSRLD